MTLPQTWWYYITPDGEHVLLNDHTNTFFLEEDGFGLEGADPIAERVAYEHGVIPVGIYLGEREVMLRIGIMATDDSAWRELDDRLCRSCSPFIDDNVPGVLRRVRADGTTRDIMAFMTGYAKSSGDREGPVYGERVMKFWCPDPFFYDPEPVEYNYNVQTQGGYIMPFEFPFSFAETNLNAHNTVWNDGDVKTWPSIYIYGPLRNPTIENETTGELITIAQTLTAGQYINVDMYECKAELYDGVDFHNITHLMTNESVFWALKRGANTIHFMALDVENGGIVFDYYNRYQSI